MPEYSEEESLKNIENTILVTGGAGFIGSNFVLEWLKENEGIVVNLDKLTYSGNLTNLDSLRDDNRHVFIEGDIGDEDLVRALFKDYRPAAVINFAAESHVDRSILSPAPFVQTNVTGTCKLLDVCREYWQLLDSTQQQDFRFLHVSTDEVYGSLSMDAPAFTESHSYQPNSPYSASKAASDHFVRAYHHTYGLPVLTTNCSNNYGPYQFPEKLIPLMIINALEGKQLPVYGDGQNVRDWLYVGDHCSAISTVLERGQTGETYNIGGLNEKTNIEIVSAICSILDELAPSANEKYADLITYVDDRPGHDRRYAMDITKIRSELGWEPVETFESGVRKTVEWYLVNTDWVKAVTSGDYRNWVRENYQERGQV